MIRVAMMAILDAMLGGRSPVLPSEKQKGEGPPPDVPPDEESPEPLDPGDLGDVEP